MPGVGGKNIWVDRGCRADFRVWPALRLLRPFHSLYVAGEDLGRTMLEATRENFRRRVIENAEIRELAERFAAQRAI
jgi:hypothetical protein